MFVGFPVADFRTTNFRTTKGAIKLHVGLNHDGYLPEFVSVTEGKCADVTAGRKIQFPKGSIVVMDKGYNEYPWYKQLNDKGITFVTRLKKNAQYRVVKRHAVLNNKGVGSDQTIELIGMQAAKKCPIRLRRIAYRDTTKGKYYVFLTNNFKLSAKSVAGLYKARCQLELFFKWIKQNPKIKSFIGTSKNAVMTQIWVAMCIYLIVAFLKLQSKASKSMQQILRVLHFNLFEKRDLMALLRGDSINHRRYNPNQFLLLLKLTGQQ